MSDNQPVLVVGATGSLGGHVVTELVNRGRQVRALVRPGSDASRLESKGVQISRGDMLDAESLDRAMTGVGAVITTAAGYTSRDKNALQIDTEGNTNLAEAAHRTGVRRFVLTSILTCDQTPQVPHFWHKKLTEDRLEQLGVPFVALRPGAFLDQLTQFGGDPFAKRRLMWLLGNPRVPLTFVLIADLARYLAEAADTRDIGDQRIDIGWDRPVSVTEIAQISSGLLGVQIRVRSIPTGLIHGAATALGPFMPIVKDMGAMADWFHTGRYVADTTRQREAFGAVPTAEDAISRFAAALGHPPASDQP